MNYSASYPWNVVYCALYRYTKVAWNWNVLINHWDMAFVFRKSADSGFNNSRCATWFQEYACKFMLIFLKFDEYESLSYFEILLKNSQILVIHFALIATFLTSLVCFCWNCKLQCNDSINTSFFYVHSFQSTCNIEWCLQILHITNV